MQKEQYIPMAKNLNPCEKGAGFHLDGFDATYRVPFEWLKANAAAFHFSDAEIIQGQTDSFRAVSNCAGIYFLLMDDEIIYVGLAKEIHRRMMAHYRKGVRWTGHAWFKAPPIHLRSIECYYIHRIRPALNKSYPPVSEYGRMIRTQN